MPSTGVSLIAAAGIQNAQDRRSASTASTAMTRWTLRTRSSTATGRKATSASAAKRSRPPSHHRDASRMAVQTALNASAETTDVIGASTCASGGGYQYAKGVLDAAPGSYSGSPAASRAPASQ